MGYITEPNGITLTVDKQKFTAEVENRIKNFIKKSKKKNSKLINKLKDTYNKRSDSFDD